MTQVSTAQRTSGWVGWIYFAAIMMIIGGGLWAILGLFAIFDDQWVVFGTDNAVLLDISAWGWVHLILGLVTLGAGFLLLQGNTLGRVLAVLMAAVSILVNFIWLPVFPVWSLVVMVIDAVVIYAVIVHGREVTAA